MATKYCIYCKNDKPIELFVSEHNQNRILKKCRECRDRHIKYCSHQKILGYCKEKDDDGNYICNHKYICQHDKYKPTCYICMVKSSRDVIEVKMNLWLRTLKQSDKKYGRYDESKYITKDFLIDLMNSEFNCCYCNVEIEQYGETNRKTWTLERIRNNEGHNTDNIKICCYGCNLRRGNRFTFDEFKEYIRLNP